MYIDWGTSIIYVYKTDLELVQMSPIEVYNLDLNWFRLKLKDLEDDADGIVFSATHSHNTEVSLGGLTYARVIEILEPYTVTFEDDQYAVNLIGANSNVGDKVNLNQVSIRSNNSAGMISSPDIEYASFQGAVWLDAVGGSDESKGNAQYPVATVERALIVAAYRGLRRIHLLNDVTFTTGHTITGFELTADSHSNIIVTVESGAECTNLPIRGCTLTGVVNGTVEGYDCLLDGVYCEGGHVHNSGINGSVTLGGTGRLIMTDCYAVDQDNPPTIDLGGSGQSLGMSNYSGFLLVGNLADSAQEISIGLSAGKVILLNTITAGTVFIAGSGYCDDYSSGATVELRGLNNLDSTAEAVWSYEGV